MARRKAPKTWNQIEAMRQKAIRFLRNVVQDEEKAQEFEAMSTQQYAEHKRIQVTENPSRQNAKIIQRSYRQMTKARQPTRAELEDTIEQLESELEEVTDARDELAEQVDAVAEAIGATEEEEEEDSDED